MNDLIRREAVKDWLQKWNGYLDNDMIARMQYRVIDIPSAEQEQRWIPVTERLPDKHITVIVSCIDDSGDIPFSYTACGYWVGLLPDDDPAWIVDGDVNYYVVTWMPLPDPWKGDADENSNSI